MRPATPLPRRRGATAAVVAAALLTAWVVTLGTTRGTPGAEPAAQAALCGLVGVAALVVLLQARLHTGAGRVLWRSTGAGLVVWGLMNALTGWRGWTSSLAATTAPSAPAVALCCLAVGLAVGLAVVALAPLVRSRNTGAGVVRDLVDSAMVTAVVLTALWYGVLEALPGSGTSSPVPVVVAVALTLEILVAVGLGVTALRTRGHLPGLGLVTAGAVGLVSGDVLASGPRPAVLGGAASWCWVLALVLLVVASGRTSRRQDADDDAPPLLSGSTFPCAAALLALASSVPASLSGTGGGPVGAWLHVGVLGLLVLRTVLLVHDGDRLTRTLEARVRHSTRAVASAGRRFEALVVHSSDVVTVVGADGVISYVSPSAQRVLGIVPDQLVGRGADALVTAPGDRTLLDAVLSALETPGSRRQLRMTVPHATGRQVVLDVCVTGLTDDPAVRGAVVNSHDVTEAVRLEEELSHRAFSDALTGLPNRALFRDRLEHALLRRASRGPVEVMYLDLDGFKAVNDTLGHGAGDELLVAVAERLCGAVREGDTVARLGGDEFAVLLEETPGGAEAERLAQRLCDAVREPFTVRGVEVRVATSVGLASTRTTTSDAEQLMRSADLAMYQAKAAHRGGYALYDPRMHEQVVERVQLEADLRAAVEHGQFRVAYQPLVDMGDGGVSGVEALVRWDHPQRGTIPPAEFVPLAETTGLIGAIGAFVLRRACHQVATWRAGVPGAERMRLSVNLSGHQLGDPRLVALVEEVLAETGLPAASLVLEITESVIVDQDEEALAALDALRALGVRLAIDDFGTGYSSLSYLHRLPVDIIKIDKSFVDRLSDGGDLSLVDAILSMATSLGMTTVAEGVEHEHQRAALAAQGCGTGQGYYFSPPVDADELPDLVRSALLAPPTAPRPVLQRGAGDETTGTVLR